MPSKILDTLYKAGLVIAATSMSGICLLILAQIVGRWFGIIVPSAEDFSGYLLCASLFYALAYSYRHNAHIRVVFLMGKLNKNNRLWLERFNLTLLLCLLAYCTYALARYCYETYVFNDVSTGFVAIPLWIPQSSMVVGLALFFLAVLQDWIGCLFGKTPAYVLAEQQGEGSE